MYPLKSKNSYFQKEHEKVSSHPTVYFPKIFIAIFGVRLTEPSSSSYACDFIFPTLNK